MDFDTDTSWCPACDCRILPKRILVPVTAPGSNPKPAPRPTARLKPRRGQARVHPPAVPIRNRIVLDQGPTPLYCSDECRLADLRRCLDYDWHPDRHSPPSPISSTSPPKSQSASSDSSGSSQSDSISSTSSITKHSEMYRSPPLPISPLGEEPLNEPAFRDFPSSDHILSAQKLPKKEVRYGQHHPEPVLGGSDRSTVWRSVSDLTSSRFQRIASSRSSVSGSTPFTSDRCSTSLPSSSSASDALMLKKFSQSFSRQASNIALPRTTVTARSSSPSDTVPTSPKRERPIVRPGAEGKLLVPDVMMRVNGSSSTSLSSCSRRRGFDPSTPLSTPTPTVAPKRPAAELRSWSYDGVLTYPVMPMPRTKRIEKRKETRVIEGQAVDVEVDVEVVEPLKCLFYWEPKRPVGA